MLVFKYISWTSPNVPFPSIWWISVGWDSSSEPILKYLSTFVVLERLTHFCPLLVLCTGFIISFLSSFLTLSRIVCRLAFLSFVTSSLLRSRSLSFLLFLCSFLCSLGCGGRFLTGPISSIVSTISGCSLTHYSPTERGIASRPGGSSENMRSLQTN